MTTEISPALPRIYAWFSGLIAEDTVLLEDLLSHGIPVDVQHPLRHTTALMEAVRLGRAPLVQFLLARGASPILLCGMPKGSPLHCAVSLKRWSIAQQLLDTVHKVAVVDSHGRTPLHLLCVQTADGDTTAQNFVIATQLIEKSCPLDALDQEGISALHHCVINNQLQLAELLLMHRASPNILIPDSKVSPIFIAAIEGNLPMAMLLMKYGANPHQSTRDSTTAAQFMPALGMDAAAEEISLLDAKAVAAH